MQYSREKVIVHFVVEIKTGTPKQCRINSYGAGGKQKFGSKDFNVC